VCTFKVVWLKFANNHVFALATTLKCDHFTKIPYIIYINKNYSFLFFIFFLFLIKLLQFLEFANEIPTQHTYWQPKGLNGARLLNFALLPHWGGLRWQGVTPQIGFLTPKWRKRQKSQIGLHSTLWAVDTYIVPKCHHQTPKIEGV